MVTKSTRENFISLLAHTVGLVNKDDPAAELLQKQIERDSSDLETIIKHTKATHNPFMNDQSDLLFNINTGKEASNEIKESLLSVPDTGEIRH